MIYSEGNETFESEIWEIRSSPVKFPFFPCPTLSPPVSSG